MRPRQLSRIAIALERSPRLAATLVSTSRKRTKTEADQEIESEEREDEGYATRVKIISETIEYIKELERKRDRLEEMKKSIGIGQATQIIMVFEKHEAQVFMENVAVNHGLLMVYSRISYESK
ncbi:hypothetical protein AAG906_013609 [Vitis piasezkii]